MDADYERQAIIDEEHLKLLPIGYWVSAGFWAVYGLFMVAYFAFIGIVFSTLPPQGAEVPPQEFMWVFLGFALIGLIVLGVLVLLKVRVGFWLRARRRYVATLVIAGITCFEIPYGTLFGVLTFVTLSRPSVRALYFSEAPAEPQPVPGVIPVGAPGPSDSGEETGT